MSGRERSIEQLVKRAVQGDRVAFSELCHVKGQHILYRCIQLMGNVQDGEDAAQEVFIRIQEAIRRLRSLEAFNVWLHKIITNTCSKLRSSRIPGGSALPLEEVGDFMAETKTEMLPEAYLADVDRRQALMDIVHDLPASMRDCVLLYYFEDMTAKEIGEVLEINEKSVNMQLYRARLKIRAELETKEPGAYSCALVPFTAISAVFGQDMARLAPAASVNACLKAVGIKKAPTAPAYGAGFLAKPLVLAAAATAAVLGVTFLASPLPALLSEPQHLAVAGEEGDMDIDDVRQQSSPSGPGGTAPKADSIVWGSDAVIGNLYLDDPADPMVRAWNPVLGATVQLYSADGTQALADPISADQPNGFMVVTGAYGAFRVLLTLPEKARFVALGTNDVKVLEGAPNKAWLTCRGSEVLVLDRDDGPITGLHVAAYYPATLTGSIVSNNGGELGGVTIDLLDTQGNIVATTETEQGGGYVFENPMVVREGDYRVGARFPLANGLQKTEDVTVYLIPGESKVVAPLQVSQLEDIFLG